MHLYRDGSLVTSLNQTDVSGASVVIIASRDEALAEGLMITSEIPYSFDEGSASHTKFESWDGVDYISVSEPSFEKLHDMPRQVEFFFSPGRLVLVHNDMSEAGEVAMHMERRNTSDLSPAHIIYVFLNLLTRDDYEALVEIEDGISEMEEMLMEDKEDDYIQKIINIRKRLLHLKRYYEALQVVLTDLDENENDFFTRDQLRHLDLVTGRVERLYNNVQNLRDYVTQVREAYQSQMDISLNQTMKIFTVITAIFSPLTLIVGWYGMNLMMPEFTFPYAYPIIILLCISIVCSSIWYFKKRKWF